MSTKHEPHKPREQYRLRTCLIHGSIATGRWDSYHHPVPPQSSGVQGFVEFRSVGAQKAPQS